MGLIFSAPPSQAWAAPMRPPRCRYSSVSTANHSRVALDASRARAATASTSAPARAAAEVASTTMPSAPHASFVSMTSMRAPEPASSPAAWRAASTVPEIPPEMWIETMSRASPTSGSQTARQTAVHERRVDGQEVADRRLRRGRQRVSRAEGVVERGEVDDVGLALGALAVVDVEADLADPELSDGLARQIVGGIGHHRDVRHAGTLDNHRDDDPGHRERHPASLPHSDRLAVPVWARRARAAPARPRLRGGPGGVAPARPPRDREAQRPAPRTAAGHREGRDLRLAADHRAPGLASVRAVVSSACALSVDARKTGSKAKSTARPAPTRSSTIAARPDGELSDQPLSTAP